MVIKNVNIYIPRYSSSNVMSKTNTNNPLSFENDSMDEAQVLIVGAEPSGLALGLALARFKVRVRFLCTFSSQPLLTQRKSVILEKDSEVTKDPRGVYLAGDAVRIFYDLGLENEVSTIGHGRYRERPPLGGQCKLTEGYIKRCIRSAFIDPRSTRSHFIV